VNNFRTAARKLYWSYSFIFISFIVHISTDSAELVSCKFKIFYCFLFLSSTEKVVGTATPKEPAEQCKVAWCFSTGDELIIQWDSSLSVSSLTFNLTSPTSLESSVELKCPYVF